MAEYRVEGIAGGKLIFLGKFNSLARSIEKVSAVEQWDQPIILGEVASTQDALNYLGTTGTEESLLTPSAKIDAIWVTSI